jgi:hypothetical protein
MGWPLRLLIALAALAFLALGIKGYWDHSGWLAFGILAATLALGWLAPSLLRIKGNLARLPAGSR